MNKPPGILHHDPNKIINTLKSRTPIEKFAIEFDVPMELAILMVSRDGEKQTANNIQMFKDYIEWLINEARKRKGR